MVVFWSLLLVHMCDFFQPFSCIVALIFLFFCIKSLLDRSKNGMFVGPCARMH